MRCDGGHKRSGPMGCGSGSLLLALGSGRFAHKLGHQLLAAAESFGDVPLAVAPNSQRGRKYQAIRHGGPLNPLAALPRQLLITSCQPSEIFPSGATFARCSCS
jgi:hypothetical protein